MTGSSGGGSTVEDPTVEEEWDRGVYWRRQGDGRDVILLHGIGSSSGAFARQFSDLSRSYRVHAWDAPGYARSHDVEGDLSTDDYVSRIAAYIETIGADERGYHLVGVSWGGVLAVGVALATKGCVGLSLVSASVGAGATPERRDAMLRRLEDLEANGLGGMVEDRVPRLLSEDASPELRRSVAELMRSSIRPKGYHSAVTAMAGTDWRDRLGEVSTPTLVCIGTSDQVTGARQGALLHRGIPHSAYFPVAGAGHLVNQERAGVTNGLLRVFFEMVDLKR